MTLKPSNKHPREEILKTEREVLEDHFIRRSLYQKITLSEDHFIRRSLYQKITLSEDQFIRRSLYQITLSEDHFIRRSLYQKISLSEDQFITLKFSNVICGEKLVGIYLQNTTNSDVTSST